MRRLILASNSPRRIELLGLLGLPFEVSPADIDEQQGPGETPLAYVRRLACEKARFMVKKQVGLVVAADTIVMDGDRLLGKPADPAEARQILRQLRGREHQVVTGLAIMAASDGRSFADVCSTSVHMRNYTDAEIDAYVATGDPLDKAGAYGIQNAGFHPVAGLDGCYASVMGLPLCHLAVGLQGFGLDLSRGLPECCQAYLGHHCTVYNTILGMAQR